MSKHILTVVVLLILGGIIATALLYKPKEVNVTEDMMPSGNSSTAVTTTETKAPVETTAPATPVKPEQQTSVQHPTEQEIAATKAAGTQKATLTTSRGVIELELNGADAPLTVANFVKLTKAKFYDGLTFHRVEPGFVIQGGDPEGTGMGGPGYQIKLEISPKLRHIEGALAMARSGQPDSAGSQFYITLAQTPKLDDNYAVFGKVTKGMDVVKSIQIGDKIKSIVIK